MGEMIQAVCEWLFVLFANYILLFLVWEIAKMIWNLIKDLF